MTPREQEFYAAVAASGGGGVHLRDLAARSGLSKGWAKDILTALREMGKIEAVRLGRGNWVWVVPELVETPFNLQRTFDELQTR